MVQNKDIKCKRKYKQTDINPYIAIIIQKTSFMQVVLVLWCKEYYLFNLCRIYRKGTSLY